VFNLQNLQTAKYPSSGVFLEKIQTDKISLEELFCEKMAKYNAVESRSLEPPTGPRK